MRWIVWLVALALAACGGGESGRIVAPATVAPRDDFYSFDVADMNGDGFADIIAAGYSLNADGSSSYHISVFLQSTQSPGTYSAPLNSPYSAVGASVYEIQAADLRGSGMPDIVACGLTELGFRVLLHDLANPGQLLPSTLYGSAANIYGQPTLKIGDIDGDLFPDVVTVGPEELVVIRQDSAAPGRFLPGQVIGYGFENVAIADVDGDGLSDLLTFDSRNDKHDVAEQLLYYRHNPVIPGQFLAPLRIDLEFFGSDIVIADVNRDSRMDLVVSGSKERDWDNYDGIVKIYSQGLGHTFAELEVLFTESNYSADKLAIADLNGDGFAELIVGNHNFANNEYEHANVQVYALNPGGFYVSTQLLSFGDEASSGLRFYSLEIADLDNDAQLDIAVSTHEIFVFFARPGAPGIYDTGVRISPRR